MNFNIAVISGDGIGVEITESAKLILQKIAQKFNHNFNFIDVLGGGIAIDKLGSPMPKISVDLCKNSDSVLLASVGGAKWDNLPPELRPEKGLLTIRKELGLFANIRPSKLLAPLSSICPLSLSTVKKGFDFIVVRELTGGIYFGKKGYIGEDYAFDTEEYSSMEIDRITKVAFEMARKRNKKVCLVDKANVLVSSRLWRTRANIIAMDYPDVSLSFMYIDNASMQIILNPSQFDVILTSNLFGDILTDESASITGSIGLIPSSSLGTGTLGLYEPIHGSAPELAGKNIANPIAMILSSALMLKNSFSLIDEADCIEKAVLKALENGYRTRDIFEEGKKLVGTYEMTKEIYNLI